MIIEVLGTTLIRCGKIKLKNWKEVSSVDNSEEAMIMGKTRRESRLLAPGK